MPAQSRIKALAKPEGRSRVGNGKDILPFVDGRSMLGRRIRELLAEFVADMGGNPSAAKEAIAKRAAVLVAWSENVEAKMANGGELDISAYTTMLNTLHRYLTSVGLERHMRDVTSFAQELKRGRAA
jgi:hypothetical protein